MPLKDRVYQGSIRVMPKMGCVRIAAVKVSIYPSDERSFTLVEPFDNMQWM
jgi:hypothetical protein